MKKTLLVALALMGSAYAHAQCGTDQVTDQLYSSPAQKEKALEKIAEDLNTYRNSVENGNQIKSAGKVIIPVVFHVIHTYGPENISKEQIESQIESLNRDFSATNTDIGSVRNEFKALIANMDIEFRLATKDPQGNCTEGITRTYSTLGRMTREETKALIGWDNKKYLNIWVVESIRNDNANEPGTTLGFAYLPQSVAANPGSLNSKDGIVVISSYVGNIGTSDANKAGRTLTHEVGHYLGLFHPFQNGCGSTNCSSSGDYVCDTPPVAEPSFGCSKSANTCNQDNPDLPDMTENFMDYANGICQLMFTQGQKQVVDYIFSQPLRGALISASNLTATGTADPYTKPSCAPIADISSDTIVLCAGTTVDFKNASYNGDITSYTWTMTGANPSTSNIENPTVLYNTPGTYNVKLEVSNAQGSSSISRNSIVMVRPSTAVAKAPQFETFQNNTFPPANWVIPSSNTLAWTRSTVSADGNEGSAVAIIDTNRETNSTASLELLPIDLSTLGNSGYLNFKVAYKRRTNASDILRLYGSIDCGVNFVLLKQYIAAGLYGPNTGLYTGTDWKPANSSEWLQVAFAIPSTNTKSNYIFKFEAVSLKGNNIYIDDINVSSFAASVKDPVAADLNIYPNPTNGELNIQATLSEATQVSLLDMTGKTIMEFGNIQPNQNNYQFNTNSVSPGMYLVVLKNTKGSQYQKLIIQK